MKHLSTIFVFIGLINAWAQPTQVLNVATGSRSLLVEQGPHSRTWQNITVETNSFGRVLTRTNRYVELGTGISKRSGTRWIDATSTIQPTFSGAAATNGAHLVSFLGNINSAGAVTVTMADGKRLVSNILGLSYFDSESGKSVFVAEVKDATGEILDGNRAAYSDAFTGVHADVIYENKLSGTEQFVVLREQLPSPAQFGFDPAKTFFQVITEFLTPPEPQVIPTEVEGGTEEVLDFGTMLMPKGCAFALQSPENKVAVTKQWRISNDGRHFLVEQVRFNDIAPMLQDLAPASATESLLRTSHGVLFQVVSGKQIPSRRAAATQMIAMRKSAQQLDQKGFAMDYTLVTAQSNFVFKGDTTYVVSNSVSLTGTTILEGGAVIKFDSSATDQIQLYPSGTNAPITCKTGPYRVAVFTSMNDNSAGDTITGSTGTPSPYQGVCLYSVGNNVNGFVQYVRFCYAKWAWLGFSDSADFWHCQFVNCGSCCSGHMNNAYFHNVLAVGCTNLTGDSGSIIGFNGEHITADACGLGAPLGGGVTNSLFTAITNIGSVVFYNSVTNASSSGIFQTVGAGKYYLASDSSYRNYGTTNINPVLLASLRQKTTYPPIVYANTYLPFSAWNLSPQAQRDSDTPDLGWHYDPIDYALGYTAVTNPAVLTVNPGTVIGSFGTNGGTYGIGLLSGGGVNFQGSPTALARLVCYNTVQEQPSSGWVEPTSGMIFDGFGGVPGSVANFRFTDFSSLAQHVNHLNMGDVIANLQDCQLHGGTVATYPPTLNLTNCLLERVYCSLWQSDSAQPVFRDNSFFGGTFDFLPFSATNAIIQDNLFDATAIPETLSGYIGGHNASVTNYDHMKPVFASDLVLSNSPQYQVGPLGGYYRLSSSALFDADTNTTAAQVGFYHYTTITNLVSGYEIKETNSWLDIGFHYVAVDSNTNAIDANGDGIPDYVSDANGNGLVDSGENAWNIKGDLGLKVLILRPASGSVLP